MVALDAGDRPLRLTAPRPVFEHPAERRSARMEENRCKDVPEVKKASEHKSGRGEHGNVVAIDAGDRPLRLTAPRPVFACKEGPFRWRSALGQNYFPLAPMVATFCSRFFGLVESSEPSPFPSFRNARANSPASIGWRVSGTSRLTQLRAVIFVGRLVQNVCPRGQSAST